MSSSDEYSDEYSEAETSENEEEDSDEEDDSENEEDSDEYSNSDEDSDEDSDAESSFKSKIPIPTGPLTIPKLFIPKRPTAQTPTVQTPTPVSNTVEIRLVSPGNSPPLSPTKLTLPESAESASSTQPKPVARPKFVAQAKPVSSPKFVAQAKPVSSPKFVAQPKPVLGPKFAAQPKPVVNKQTPGVPLTKEEEFDQMLLTIEKKSILKDPSKDQLTLEQLLEYPDEGEQAQMYEYRVNYTRKLSNIATKIRPTMAVALGRKATARAFLGTKYDDSIMSALDFIDQQLLKN